MLVLDTDHLVELDRGSWLTTPRFFLETYAIFDRFPVCA